jgi:hypothetical protein
MKKVWSPSQLQKRSKGTYGEDVRRTLNRKRNAFTQTERNRAKALRRAGVADAVDAAR